MFITGKKKRVHVGRQVNLKIFLTIMKAVSNLYLGSRWVVLVIHLLLLLRKYMRSDEAAERLWDVVRIESKLRGAVGGGEGAAGALLRKPLNCNSIAIPWTLADWSPCAPWAPPTPPPCTWALDPLPLHISFPPSLSFSSNFPRLMAVWKQASLCSHKRKR